MSENNKNNSEEKTQNYLKKTLYSISIIVLVSIVSKVLNLVCNIFLARMINKETYGLAKVYLEFAFTLLLYFPRETIRKTAQKFCPDNQNEEKEKANFEEVCQLNWILVFVFSFLSLPLFSCFINFGGEGLSNVKLHLLIYILSANLEMIIEPIIIYLNIKIENQHKLAGVTLGNYSRILSNLFFAYFFGFQLWSFTLSRMISTILYVSYILYIGLYKFQIPLQIMLPKFTKIKIILLGYIKQRKSNSYENPVEESHYTLSPKLKETFNSFVKTTLLKMVLTHTEKFSLSFFLNLTEAAKGDYSFISDNFAIIMRYILEPIEENFFNFINRVKETKLNSIEKSTAAEQPLESINNKNYLLKILKISIRFMLIFGILLIGYIFIIGREVITLVYTEKWSTDSSILILKAYSIYVAIISINGIVEAYANATYSTELMSKYNLFMIYNSIVLVALSIILAHFNIIGLIVANGLAMLFRISVHFYLIFSLNKNNSLSVFIEFLTSALFKLKTVIVITLSLICACYVKFIIGKLFVKVFVSALIFLLNCAIIFLIERREFQDIFKNNK